MFIQTEPTSNPATLKFLPGRPVLSSGTLAFASLGESGRSPLAQRLFAIAGIEGIRLELESVVVSKVETMDWELLKPSILSAIMTHFTEGHPVVVEGEDPAPTADEVMESWDGDNEVAAKIKELLETRIRPAVEPDGGGVTYRGFKDGVVLLEFIGPAFNMLGGIENILRHYVPEVTRVTDFRDAMPKPGMETEEARAIQQILTERINPSIASHGGRITLVDVQDDTVYVRLEGGCQGCGMADVTLKQGVAQEIQRSVPAITQVLDVTDHAGGENPYYQPGKGGMSDY